MSSAVQTITPTLTGGSPPDPERAIPHRLSERDVGPRRSTLDLGHGARAVVSEDHELSVYAPDGQLVFEYDPATGRQRVVAPAGRLEIVSARDVTLRSGNEISLEARRVTLRGSEAVALRCGRGRTGMELSRREMRLASDRLLVAAEKTEVTSGETTLAGNRIEGAFERARLVAGRVESVARTVIEKAGNVYRSVENLAQLRAGRVRTLVEGSHVCRARKATLYAQEDVRVQADKIHLG